MLEQNTYSRSRPYIPKWKGMETFKGIVHHSSLWPEEPVDMAGKRVAVIGAGESTLCPCLRVKFKGSPTDGTIMSSKGAQEFR